MNKLQLELDELNKELNTKKGSDKKFSQLIHYLRVDQVGLAKEPPFTNDEVYQADKNDLIRFKIKLLKHILNEPKLKKFDNPSSSFIDEIMGNKDAMIAIAGTAGIMLFGLASILTIAAVAPIIIFGVANLSAVSITACLVSALAGAGVYSLMGLVVDSISNKRVYHKYVNQDKDILTDVYNSIVLEHNQPGKEEDKQLEKDEQPEKKADKSYNFDFWTLWRSPKVDVEEPSDTPEQQQFKQ